MYPSSWSPAPNNLSLSPEQDISVTETEFYHAPSLIQLCHSPVHRFFIVNWVCALCNNFNIWQHFLSWSFYCSFYLMQTLGLVYWVRVKFNSKIFILNDHSTFAFIPGLLCFLFLYWGAFPQFSTGLSLKIYRILYIIKLPPNVEVLFLA